MRGYKKYFMNEIHKIFTADYRNIIANTEKHYAAIAPSVQFASSSSNPIDRRLDFSAYFLAFIKTLDERGETFDGIRKICIDIVTEYVRPKNRWQQWLKRLPVKLVDTWVAKRFIKAFSKRVSQNKNPDGFVANIITDKNETYGLGYGIDIVECGICKLFKKQEYENYASILCEIDKITTGLAGLEMIRSGTIAMGAKKCDFRYKKLSR
jgi:L-2-amino-thiazoline-4-carboxylic acid hydrolase